MKLRTRAKTSRTLRAAATAAKRTASKAFFSPEDPDGSYTGVPADGGKPMQDADDL